MINSTIYASGIAAAFASRTAETHAGTTTSWLSMITSPPIDPRCSYHLYNPDGAHHTLIAFDPRLEAAANMTCLPREAAEWYTQENLPFGATTGTVTSLGPMLCPNGYTTASTSEKDVASTMVFCCPSEYAFATSANHGTLYGCTSVQTRQVTVHLSGVPASTMTLSAGIPSRAPNVAGVAVNGWVFNSTPTYTTTPPTQTTNADIWAKKHLGMTTAEFSGIILGVLTGIGFFLTALHCCITRKWFRHKAKPDEEGARGEPGNARRPSVSESQAELNPSRDVELSDLDSNGTRVPSVAETVVHHIEHSKSEASTSTDDEERTA